MNDNEKVYTELQKHLHKQVVGFPAIKSGAEIRILKHIFEPNEAKCAKYLSYKHEPLETIYERAKSFVKPMEELEKLLDEIELKGGIERKTENDKKYYCNSPLLVGMYEFQTNNLTPEFIKDFDEYSSSLKFGIEFLSTKLPQTRTIPIEKSLTGKRYISSYEQVTQLLKASQGPFALVECICRKKEGLKGNPCKVTERKYTCVAVGIMGEAVIRQGTGKEVKLDNLLSVIRQNQKEGLVLQTSNTKKADFICSCCGCCCGPLKLHKFLPKPLDFWSSNFYAAVDNEKCNGCGECIKGCQVEAIKLLSDISKIKVYKDRCIGCGHCVSKCTRQALSLVKKTDIPELPETREDLHEIIMANKKGWFGKLEVLGKLIVDKFKTGHSMKRT